MKNQDGGMQTTHRILHAVRFKGWQVSLVGMNLQGIPCSRYTGVSPTLFKVALVELVAKALVLEGQSGVITGCVNCMSIPAIPT